MTNKKKPKKERLEVSLGPRKKAIILIKSLTSMLMAKFDVQTYEEFISNPMARKRKKRNFETEFELLKPLYSEDGKYSIKSAAIYNALLEIPASLLGRGEKGKVRTIQIDGGEFLPIENSEPIMRKDIVYLDKGRGKKVPDIRVRCEFFDWQIRVPIIYDPEVLNAEDIANLFVKAGIYCGLGQWRPSSPKPGVHGRFTVASIEG